MRARVSGASASQRDAVRVAGDPDVNLWWIPDGDGDIERVADDGVGVIL